MNVQEGDLVAVRYTGRLDDGKVFDSNLDAPEALRFHVGAEQVIPGFERALLGLAKGESRTVRIPPEEAYGDRHEGLTARLERVLFEEGPVEVGIEVDLEDKEGELHAARIVALDDQTVTVDFNHPLAGEALTFELQIEDIERA